MEKQDTTRLSLCSNTQTPGSWEYNLVEMSNQIVLDGKGCPVEKVNDTNVDLARTYIFRVRRITMRLKNYYFYRTQKLP